MSTHTIVIPDIGTDEQVDVIEVLVAPGEQIQQEQSLITLESDKASMEIPASHAGQITEVLVQVGDKVCTGDAIAVSELSEDEPSAPDEEAVEKTTPGHSEQAKPAAASTAAAAAPTDAPSDAVDLVVLGAGPGGYSAAFRAADLGLEVVLVERYDTLGGVCLNVGCIPSKSLLHTISAYETALELKEQGISFKDPDIDLDAMRAFKDSVIGKLTRGLAGMAKARKVRVVQGVGSFEDAHHLRIEHEGKTEKIAFRQAIIAAGSRAIHLPFMPEDERIIDSTGALKLKSIPERMLVIGGGIIGLEMATLQ